MICLAFAAFTAFAFSCNNTAPKGNNTNEQGKPVKVIYTCEMHPEVISDKPGKCPKCGMTLVKKTVPADSTKVQPADTTKKAKGMKM